MERSVCGLTTCFSTRVTIKSSPETENQVTSKSTSVWGQNLEFSAGNLPKKPNKEQSHVCVVAHMWIRSSGL